VQEDWALQERLSRMAQVHNDKERYRYSFFVNESLYSQFSKSTWWIDSGATIHVANSL
jgi:hypothetical protein